MYGSNNNRAGYENGVLTAFDQVGVSGLEIEKQIVAEVALKKLGTGGCRRREKRAESSELTKSSVVTACNPRTAESMRYEYVLGSYTSCIMPPRNNSNLKTQIFKMKNMERREVSIYLCDGEGSTSIGIPEERRRTVSMENAMLLVRSSK